MFGCSEIGEREIAEREIEKRYQTSLVQYAENQGREKEFEGEKNTRRGVELCFLFLRFLLNWKHWSEADRVLLLKWCSELNAADKNREREKEEGHKSIIQVPSTNGK